MLFDRTISLRGMLNKVKFTSKWYGSSGLPSEQSDKMIRAGDENPYFYLDENDAIKCAATSSSDGRICYRMIAKKNGHVGRVRWEKGDKGGYLSIDTLIIPGKAWVANKAFVAGSALHAGTIIKDSAQIMESEIEKSVITGNAEIFQSKISGISDRNHHIFPSVVQGQSVVIGSTLVGSKVKDNAIVVNSFSFLSLMNKKSALACVDYFKESEITDNAIFIGDKKESTHINNAHIKDRANVFYFFGRIDKNVWIDKDAFVLNSNGVIQNDVHIGGKIINSYDFLIEEKAVLEPDSMIYCTDDFLLRNSYIGGDAVVCSPNGFRLVNAEFINSHLAYELEDEEPALFSLLNAKAVDVHQGTMERNEDIIFFVTDLCEEAIDGMYEDIRPSKREELPEMIVIEEMLHNEENKVIEYEGW